MKTSSSEYNTKCIVHECNNRMWEGEFVGQLCKPCYFMLTTGELVPSTSFVARLFRERDEALKENARLRPALMGFSQAEELMELREDLRKELRCSLDLARQNNILQDYNKILGQELQDTKQELEGAKREIAKLKASSNENYWELSRQRDNMRFALHKIDDAVRYGFKHGSKSGEAMK